MKKIAIIIIKIYQNTISLILRQLIGINAICRFSPSCSEYTKISIEKQGLRKGIKMGLIRLLQCQPFSNRQLWFKK